jgi:hypothetical protein
MDLKSFFASSSAAAFRPPFFVSAALRVFSEHGLRHRYIKPHKINMKRRKKAESFIASTSNKKVFFCLLKSIKINKAQNFINRNKPKEGSATFYAAML